MLVVDSHCHVSSSWYEPVESLIYLMNANGVDHAVLVQMQGQNDNSYQFECLRRYPGKFASVVAVDTQGANAIRDLERLVSEGASGLRLRPTVRSPGDAPLAIWRAAERLGMPISCIGSDDEFASPEFLALATSLSGLRIVVEHLGSDKPINGTLPDATRSIFDLAHLPNIFVKLPGLGEFCSRATPVKSSFPFRRPLPTLLADAINTFGPDRLMWGSDYPPVSFREGYRNALQLPMKELQYLGKSDQELIFGGVACQTFPIR